MALSGQPAPMEAGPAGGVGARPAGRRWLHILAGLGWVLLCSTLGAMLMVLPWLWVWERNYFATRAPGWAAVWLNPYLRGAVTGLGVVNVGISFRELLRLWKWRFPEEEKES